MKRAGYILCLLILLIVPLSVQAQTLLPKPEPPRAVNDYAGLLDPSEVQALENKLRTFTDTTSNAIVIVIVNDLQGYDRSEFAYIIGKEWGVGQADFNNGVVVLVRPKTEESGGQAFIATGYGLEGAIPDIACADIIDREMIPHFRNGEYYAGLDAGVNVIMALASGEYSYDNYIKNPGIKSSGAIPAIIFIIIVFVIIMIAGAGNSNNRNFKKGGSSNLPLWLLLGLLSSGRSHGGSWGGFSGGSGGFSGGGGGGGFGGFGGGGFGGGGAGGSW